ncbi:MAG: methyltransferase, partial [Bacteroidales bacterium]|nr:methyltransferase [Bacteroidales bacterium]
PQFLRQHFNFMKWPDFDRFLWKKIKQNVMEQQSDIELQIVAADIDSSAVEAATFNIKNIRMHKDISIIHSDFFALKNPFENGFIISNPPYGERLDMNEPNAFYRKMRDQLKNNYSGYKACLFSANNQALKSIRLKPNRKIPLFNGALECRLFCYDLFNEGRE